MSDKKGSSDNAGSIRAAGGAFAKLEAANEDEYFYKQVHSNQKFYYRSRTYYRLIISF